MIIQKPSVGGVPGGGRRALWLCREVARLRRAECLAACLGEASRARRRGDMIFPPASPGGLSLHTPGS